MNLFKFFLKNLVVSILNTIITVVIFYWNIMAIINGLNTPNADWNQIFTYLACSVVILFIMWFMSFLKFIRNFLIIILVVLLALWLSLPKFFPNINDGLCVTLGACKEGVEVKTVSGKILINQQNCTKQGWVWNAKKDVCETKIKKQK